MGSTIKKGQIYSLKKPNNSGTLSKREHRNYLSMCTTKAPYFLALSRLNHKSVLCAPILKREHRFTVKIALRGRIYYIDCLHFFSGMDDWLEPSDLHIADSLNLIDRIYQTRKTHNLVLKHRRNKQALRKKAEAQELKMLKEIDHFNYPKERPASSVSWRISHPAQGVRTSPR